MRKKTTKNFLLLELMLALGLIAGCALPLLKGPLLYAKAHQTAAEELELFFLSEKALSEVKENLHKQIPSWKEIISTQKEPLCLQEKTLHLPTMQSIVTEKRTIRSCLIKEDRSGKPWAKIHLEIAYKHPKQKKVITKFTHTLLLCEEEELIDIK